MSFLKKIFGQSSNESKARNKKGNAILNPKQLSITSANDLMEGHLLVSEPFSQDPRFDKSVVLVIGHANGGNILGIVLNKKSNEQLHETFPDVPISNDFFYWGGPVGGNIFGLHNLNNPLVEINGSKGFSEDMGIIFDFENFKQNSNTTRLKGKNYRFYNGASLWSPEQIENEINGRKGWKAYDIGDYDILSTDSLDLWNRFHPGFTEPKNGNIMPIVRANYGHEMYKDDKRSDDKTSITMPEGQQLLTREITDDLSLFFVEEQGQMLQYLNEKYLVDNAHMNLKHLENLSILNLLENVSPNIEMRPISDDVIMVTAGGEYESSLILLEGVTDFLHNEKGENLIIGLPCRDMFLITNEGNENGINKIKELTDIYFNKQEVKGLISKGLYRKKAQNNELELVDHAF